MRLPVDKWRWDGRQVGVQFLGYSQNPGQALQLLDAGVLGHSMAMGASTPVVISTGEQASCPF